MRCSRGAGVSARGAARTAEAEAFRVVLAHAAQIGTSAAYDAATCDFSRSPVPLASVYPLVATRSLARVFTYEVPAGVGKGAVVALRLGGAAARGVVVETGVDAPPGIEPAPVGRVLDELPPVLVDLALWLAAYYERRPGARSSS